jgi:hypothetical protein
LELENRFGIHEIRNSIAKQSTHPVRLGCGKFGREDIEKVPLALTSPTVIFDGMGFILPRHFDGWS